MATRVALTGNPVDGLAAIGPLTDDDVEALEDELSGEEWWVTELHPLHHSGGGEHPQHRAEVRAVVDEAHARGTQPSDLDEVVIDAAVASAADVNNRGLEAQVAFLVDHLGLDETRRTLGH